MKFAPFLKTWHGTGDENRFHRRSNAVLLGLNLLLLIAFMAKGQTVVLVPPNLADTGSISASSASDEVRTSWALYYATLIGNVTPGNVAFLANAMGTGLTPRLYHDVNQAMSDQVKQVQTEQITTHFSAAQTRIDPASGHVLVSGQLITEGVRGNSEREIRTYEFGFVVSHYRVLLDTMVVHKGDFTPGQKENAS